ncbi:MAG: hypothetical protein ACI9HI_002239 [Salinirussus sp.]
MLTATGGVVVALAGCLGDGGGGDDERSGDDDAPEAVDEELRLGDGVVLNTAFPVRLADPDTEEVVANVHYHPDFSHWHRMPLSVPLEQQVRYRVVVTNSDDEEIALGPDGELTVEMEPADDTPSGLVAYEVDGASIDMYGNRPGVGDYVFSLVNNGEQVWQGSLLSVSVEG